MAETSAHCVLVNGMDQAAGKNAVKCKLVDIDDAAVAANDHFSHGGADRRSGLESGAAEPGSHEQAVDSGYFA